MACQVSTVGKELEGKCRKRGPVATKPELDVSRGRRDDEDVASGFIAHGDPGTSGLECETSAVSRYCQIGDLSRRPSLGKVDHGQCAVKTRGADDRSLLRNARAGDRP